MNAVDINDELIDDCSLIQKTIQLKSLQRNHDLIDYLSNALFRRIEVCISKLSKKSINVTYVKLITVML